MPEEYVHREAQYTCEFCDFKTDNDENFKIHQEVEFLCNKCNFKSKCHDGVEKHRILVIERLKLKLDLQMII